MASGCNHVQIFSVEMMVSRTFCPGLSGTYILLISASQVAKIIGMEPPASGLIAKFLKNLFELCFSNIPHITDLLGG
jgi:hypothetical protein